MAYISKITDLSGTTYDIKDAAVPEWAKSANPPSYELTYDPDCSVGLAEVGSAVTHDPNYIQTGQITQTMEDVSFLTGMTAKLDVKFEDAYKTLFINGITLTPTTATKNVATSAPVFNGNGVHFVIEEDNL